MPERRYSNLDRSAVGWLNSHYDELAELLDVAEPFTRQDVGLSHDQFARARANRVIVPAGWKGPKWKRVRQWRLHPDAREALEDGEPEQTLPCGCRWHVPPGVDEYECKFCGAVHDRATIREVASGV